MTVATVTPRLHCCHEGTGRLRLKLQRLLQAGVEKAVAFGPSWDALQCFVLFSVGGGWQEPSVTVGP